MHGGRDRRPPPLRAGVVGASVGVPDPATVVSAVAMRRAASLSAPPPPGRAANNPGPQYPRIKRISTSVEEMIANGGAVGEAMLPPPSPRHV